jgi:phage terminase small subunit
MSKKPLNKKAEKIRMFCREYVKDFNGTRAARAAGFAASGAHVQASRLLKNTTVQEYIARLTQGTAKRAKMDGDAVLLELKKLALADLRPLFDANGKLKDTKDWPDDLAVAVSSVKIKENRNRAGEVVGHTKELKLWDKTKALELIGKNLKLFTDKLELGGDVSVNVTQVDYEEFKKLNAKFDSEY